MIGLTVSNGSHASHANSSSLIRRATLDLLRGKIAQIERTAAHGLGCASTHLQRMAQPVHQPWHLGVPAIDILIGANGLDSCGLHEVASVFAGKSSGGSTERAAGAAAQSASRRMFSVALALRRLGTGGAAANWAGKPVLWCLPTAVGHEMGVTYGHGLRVLGLDPGRLIIVTPRKAQDVLWAMEEGLKSGCLSLVIGELSGSDRLDMTAARRLALAAASALTPSVLVTHGNAQPAVATATRWRVQPIPGAAHPLDFHAPGNRRFKIWLERCRSRPLAAGAVAFTVEWSDATHSFHLVSAFSDRAAAQDHQTFSGSRQRGFPQVQTLQSQLIVPILGGNTVERLREACGGT